DGEAHPAEVKFRAELSQLLEADLAIELVEDAERPHVSVLPPAPLPKTTAAHPFFDQFEHHYSRDPEKIMRQLAADREVVQRATHMFAAQGAAGRGRLAGKQNVGELTGASFQDGHVVVCPAQRDKAYELTVLGDLHGCYSCLKA